jgi:hypothetical protein
MNEILRHQVYARPVVAKDDSLSGVIEKRGYAVTAIYIPALETNSAKLQFLIPIADGIYKVIKTAGTAVTIAVSATGDYFEPVTGDIQEVLFSAPSFKFQILDSAGAALVQATAQRQFGVYMSS